MQTPSKINELQLARIAKLGDRVAGMSVAEAFKVAFDALLRASGRTATDVADEMGISQATMTKLRKGQRGASFEMLERVREAFGVTPSQLFDPDKALAQLGLARTPSTTNGVRLKGSVSNYDTGVNSGLPAHHDEGGSALAHPDQELLTALLAYWDTISPAGRLELVGHGHRLRTSATGTPVAGFKHG